MPTVTKGVQAYSCRQSTPTPQHSFLMKSQTIDSARPKDRADQDEGGQNPTNRYISHQSETPQPRCGQNNQGSEDNKALFSANRLATDMEASFWKQFVEIVPF